MNKELADLRKKSVEQLNAELMSARETQFGLRIKHKTGQLNEVSDLVKLRNGAKIDFLNKLSKILAEYSEQNQITMILKKENLLIG